MCTLALSLAVLSALWPSAIVWATPRLLDFRPFLPVPDEPFNCADHDGGTNTEFLIIGAGLSGLAAAHFLHAQTVNCTMKILEANSLPGGRVQTYQSGPFRGMERGAGWVHDYQNHPMLAVAHWAGIRTRFVGGNSSYIGGDEIRIFDGSEEVRIVVLRI